MTTRKLEIPQSVFRVTQHSGHLSRCHDGNDCVTAPSQLAEERGNNWRRCVRGSELGERTAGAGSSGSTITAAEETLAAGPCSSAVQCHCFVFRFKTI